MSARRTFLATLTAAIGAALWPRRTKAAVVPATPIPHSTHYTEHWPTPTPRWYRLEAYGPIESVDGTWLVYGIERPGREPGQESMQRIQQVWVGGIDTDNLYRYRKDWWPVTAERALAAWLAAAVRDDLQTVPADVVAAAHRAFRDQQPLPATCWQGY